MSLIELVVWILSLLSAGSGLAAVRSATRLRQQAFAEAEYAVAIVARAHAVIDEVTK